MSAAGNSLHIVHIISIWSQYMGTLLQQLCKFTTFQHMYNGYYNSETKECRHSQQQHTMSLSKPHTSELNHRFSYTYRMLCSMSLKHYVTATYCTWTLVFTHDVASLQWSCFNMNEDGCKGPTGGTRAPSIHMRANIQARLLTECRGQQRFSCECHCSKCILYTTALSM